MFDQRQPATLGITGVLVGSRPDHELALVRLADIGMHAVGHDNTGEDRLNRLGHQRLQRIAFKRHANTGRIHHDRGMTGSRNSNLFRSDKALGSLNTGDTAVRATANGGYRAVLNDIDTTCRRPTGITPCHRIMACSTRATLKRRANDGIARSGRNIERRAEFLGFLGRQPDVIDTVKAVGMHMALEALNVMDIVREHQNAALRIHDVVVQLLAQAIPQIKRVVIKLGTFVIEVVRPNNRRVTAGVPTAKPALVDHGNIGDAVFLGQIISRTKTMTTRADDDDIVFGLRLTVGPLRLPVFLAAKGIFDKR